MFIVRGTRMCHPLAKAQDLLLRLLIASSVQGWTLDAKHKERQRERCAAIAIPPAAISLPRYTSPLC